MTPRDDVFTIIGICGREKGALSRGANIKTVGDNDCWNLIFARRGGEPYIRVRNGFLYDMGAAKSHITEGRLVDQSRAEGVRIDDCGHQVMILLDQSESGNVCRTIALRERTR